MGRSLKRRLAERRTSARRGGRGSLKKVSTFVTVAISISFFIHLMVVANVSTISACVFRTWWQRRLKRESELKFQFQFEPPAQQQEF